VAALRGKLVIEVWTEQRLLRDAWNIDVRAVNAQALTKGFGVVALVVLDDRSAQAMSGEKDVLETARLQKAMAASTSSTATSNSDVRKLSPEWTPL
jgi:hypothetical protein